MYFWLARHLIVWDIWQKLFFEAEGTFIDAFIFIFIDLWILFAFFVFFANDLEFSSLIRKQKNANNFQCVIFSISSY